MADERMNPGRFDGEWWLPSSPDRKVPGTLVVADDGGCELHLIGALGSAYDDSKSVTNEDGSQSYVVTEESLRSSGVFPRVLGSTENTGFTLDDCFQLHRSGFLSSGRAIQRLHVHRAFRAVHFDGDEPLAFRSIVARLHGMGLWVNRSGINSSIDYRENPKTKAIKVMGGRLEVKPVNATRLDGVDGAKVSIEHAYKATENLPDSASYLQNFDVRVSFSALTELDAMLGQVSLLQDLVTIGLGRPAAFDRVSLRHPQVVHKFGRRRYQIPIEMIAPWIVKPDESAKPLRSHEVVFTMKDLGGRAEVSGWLANAHVHRSALSRVMATRYSNSMYAVDSLMNCAAAIEAYDRVRVGGTASYLQRINRTISHVGGPFDDLVGDAGKWAVGLKNSRNTVAHHLASIEGGSSEQIFLARSAYWLFIMALLKDSGAPPSLFEKVLGHGSIKWLQTNLQSVM